jgi:hypothetical protein
MIYSWENTFFSEAETFIYPFYVWTSVDLDCFFVAAKRALSIIRSTDWRFSDVQDLQISHGNSLLQTVNTQSPLTGTGAIQSPLVGTGTFQSNSPVGVGSVHDIHATSVDLDCFLVAAKRALSIICSTDWRFSDVQDLQISHGNSLKYVFFWSRNLYLPFLSFILFGLRIYYVMSADFKLCPRKRTWSWTWRTRLNITRSRLFLGSRQASFVNHTFHRLTFFRCPRFTNLARKFTRLPRNSRDRLMLRLVLQILLRGHDNLLLQAFLRGPTTKTIKVFLRGQ